MNVRVQTYGKSILSHSTGLPTLEPLTFRLLTATEEGTNVYDALEKGLDDLMDLCDVVTDKFTLARDAFAAKE